MLKVLSSSSKGAAVALGLLGMAAYAGAAPQGTEQVQHLASEAKPDHAIARAVAELAHPDAGVRERASRFLWLAGKAAMGALTEAAASGDPEVAARARSILLDFKFGIYPDTPAEIRELIVRYRDGQASEKAAALEALWGKGKPAYPVIARLWLAEKDERLSSELYQRIVRLGPEMASAFVAEEEYEAAEKLLEAGVSGGNEASIRGMAVYRLLRGESEAAIQRLRKAAGPIEGNRAQLLAYLHRARGDERGMRELLPRVDAGLREQLLVEMADWAALVALKKPVMARGASIEQVGLLAAYQRLANDAGFAATLKPLAQGGGPSQRTSAVAMVMNGQTAEARELLLTAGNELAAFQLLVAQQRYGEALALAERAQPKEASDALRLSAMKGAVMHHLGEAEQARALFDALAQRGTTGHAAGLEAALRWEIDERVDFFTAKLLDRSRPIADPDVVLKQVFHRRGDEAAYWWSFFREERATESPAETLGRVRAIIDKRLPRDEVVALARRVRQSTAGLPRHWRYKRLEVSGATLLSYGADAEAEAVLRELAEETGRVETYVQLGHAAARQAKWEAAAEYYSQAMQRDRSLTVPLYLRGWALVQLGQARAGEALMEQAVLMPLANEAERYRLAEALREVGLADAAMRQYELILTTGPAHSEVVSRVLWRLLFDERFVDQDLTRASRLADQTVVGFFGNLDDFEITTYLGVAHLAERLRARALLTEGKVDAAMAVAHASFDMLPASASLVIEIKPQLEKLGQREKADELVARAVTFHEKLIAEHPRCASHHNSMAWTLARCRRQLDKALAHAKRAAALEPENCAILDTLAEVYFQRGETEQAIREIRKCIELEPGVERHRLALERFAKLGPETEPPEE